MSWMWPSPLCFFLLPLATMSSETILLLRTGGTEEPPPKLLALLLLALPLLAAEWAASVALMPRPPCLLE